MPSRILFVFVDGVGIGPAGEANLLSTLSLPAFSMIGGGQPWQEPFKAIRSDDHVFYSIDPNLGLDGLPQSGTGQASLFSGINCAEIAGRHYGPYPHSTSRPIIEESNLFTRLIRDAAISRDELAFANAYPERFFSYVRTTNRWTVTTLCCMSAEIRLHSDEDLLQGRAIAADITGAGWPGSPVPTIDEKTAARRLRDLSTKNRLTLFEYYLTDKAGHGRPGAKPDAVLRSLDAFFGELIDTLPDYVTFILTSDHGNLEDISTRSHTRNGVPFAAIGPLAPHFHDLKSILDVTPAIVRALRDNPVL